METINRLTEILVFINTPADWNKMYVHRFYNSERILNTPAPNMEEAIIDFEQSKKSAEKFIASLDKYENFDILTNTMLNKSVKNPCL